MKRGTTDGQRGTLASFRRAMGRAILAFWHEDMEVIYVLCELASRIVVFAEKRAEDKRSKPEYVMLQDISTLSTGFSGANTASAIRLYGGFLFAGNRGDDSIAMYEIAEDWKSVPLLNRKDRRKNAAGFPDLQ